MTAAQPLKKHPVHKRSRVEIGLRELVSSLTPGDRLPPLPYLRRHFGVASGTVQAAVAVLSDEGLVIRRHGAGTFVLQAPPYSPSSPRPPATQTLAVFAGIASAYYRDLVDLLIPLAAPQGLGIECRYADEGLTRDDVLRYEARAASSGSSGGGVAGFLAIGYEMAWVAAAMTERGHRAVVLGEPEVGVDLHVPAVFSDAEQGGYRAARHLLDQGHRRIAFLHMRSDDWLAKKQRWQGHLRALTDAGVSPPDPEFILHEREQVDYWYREPEAARRFFAAPGAPTAVAAWTDALAIKLMGALQRAGLRVPDDVALIGYDNCPGGDHCWPPLDSVAQHTDALVREALRLLSQPVLSFPAKAEPATAAPFNTPTLICRGSCRCGGPRRDR